MFIDPTPYMRVYLELAKAMLVQEESQDALERFRQAYAHVQLIHSAQEKPTEEYCVDWDAELRQLGKE
jgi:hypothetical protein